MNEAIERLRSALAGRYEIDREVGSGGMATVYLATDVRHQRRVALKVLRPELAATLGPERFLQEVRVTANLQHPHILPLFDSGEADGFLYYVMPFVDGESLRDRLAREGELPVPEAARLLRDVVDALAAAHAMGVVHRDIKPENVLLSGRHAMVTDFGVAKAVSEATGRHRLTTMGVALGTPTYMAPEQAAADENIDHRADIYAVGAVAYELLTGRPPFSGRTPQAMLSAHVTEAPRPVSEERASVPPGLETLVMRCLEKKPADRWQRAEEMLPVLESFATPSAGVTPTGTAPVAVGERPRVSWAKVGAPAVLVAVALTVWFGRGALGGGGTASPTESVDPGLFAVVPFRVSGADASLSYLREGMVDLLSVKLSGAARAVEPRTVLDAWRRAGGGDSDPPLDAIVRISTDLGAGRALLGSAVGSPQQVTLSASLYEAPQGRELATASVAGSADELPDLIDRLAAEVLSLEAGEAQERLAGLTTTSPDALRAYLQGMAAYRHGLYEEAAERFVEATSSDSTFAIAALYMGEASNMTLSGVPGAGRAGEIVRAHRDRLGPRDRAYSLVLYPDSADGRSTIERWEEAIPSLSDRPEAWYRLGDLLLHYGAATDRDGFLGRAKEAFSRAVALDSTYFTPLHHLVWIAYLQGDTAFALRTMERYLQTDQVGAVADEFRYSVAAIRRDDAALTRLDADMTSLDGDVLGFLTLGPNGGFYFPFLDMERADLAARELIRRATTPADRVGALNRLYFIRMNGGRPGEGEAVLREMGPLLGRAERADQLRIFATVYWDGDRAAAEQAAARLRADRGRDGDVTYALATWDLAGGRTSGGPEAVTRLRAAGTVVDSVRALVLETRLAHILDDPRTLTLGAALEDEVKRIRTTNEIRSHGNLGLAEIFEARGDLARALAASRRAIWNVDGDRYATTFAREEGRLAAAAGDLESAVAAYERYLFMRMDPEPVLQPEVDRIRAEVEELRRRTGSR